MTFVSRPSDHQIQMMAHATGREALGHRNHYVASVETVGEWESLMNMGLASRESHSPAFYVTSRGLDVLYGVLRPKRDEEKKSCAC